MTANETVFSKKIKNKRKALVTLLGIEGTLVACRDYSHCDGTCESFLQWQMLPLGTL